MIVVVGSLKGGCGKSTIATNLAVLRAEEGRKILLVDSDEELKSICKWSNQRDVTGIKTTWTTVLISGKEIFFQVPRLAEHYDDVIIDVGGKDVESLKSAMALANIFLVPFRPRSLDLWCLKDLDSIVGQMKRANHMQSFSFINQADSRGCENEASIKILRTKSEHIHCLGLTVGMRKPFATAIDDGYGVTELKPLDKKASKEIRALYEAVYTNCTANV